MPAKPSIDVVIPVYNAPVLTRRCVDSILACLKESIGHIYIQDDASNAETRQMLDQLPYDCVNVHHAKNNQGFGLSVNEAVSRSRATYVLVLNSDTHVTREFLPLLCDALAADPQLALQVEVRCRDEHVDAAALGRRQRPAGAIDVFGVAPGQGRDDRAADAGRHHPDRLRVGVGSDRETRLDDVDAKRGKLLRDLELLAGPHRKAGRLFAVSERRVEDRDPVVGHLSSDVPYRTIGRFVQFIVFRFL